MEDLHIPHLLRTPQRKIDRRPIEDEESILHSLVLNLLHTSGRTVQSPRAGIKIRNKGSTEHSVFSV